MSLFNRQNLFRSVLLTGLLSLIFADGVNAALLPLRPLPVSNLNESAGADRSNNSFTQSDPTQRMNGDFFVLPNLANAYEINSITVWSVGSILGEAIGQEFQSVSLYGGVRTQSSDTFGLLSTGTPNDFFEPNSDTVLNSNADIRHTQVQYKNGENYEGIGTPGVYYPIWQNTFTNLHWIVPGNSVVEFAVWGQSLFLDPSSLYGYWFTHVSNALEGGTLALGADGAFLQYDFDNLQNPPFRVDPAQQGLWDKGADVNVVIDATPIPEPGYGVALIASLGLFGMLRRKLTKA